SQKVGNEKEPQWIYISSKRTDNMICKRQEASKKPSIKMNNLTRL
ncbi:Uncharacterized protein APZ42_006479, partial [Daphnia magna]